MKMPVLFIGHGSPENVIEDNSFTKHLKYLGKVLPKPKAIMVVSAHWMTRGTFVSSSPVPQMIYDFIGFPDELYEIIYSCNGAPEIANGIAEKFSNKIKTDTSYGLDHASWTLMKYIYPDANIPVFEMSIDLDLPLKQHFENGKHFAYLRNEGVMVIGSGNMVHNLRDINSEGRDAEVFDWAATADETLKKLLINKDFKALMDPHALGQEVKHSVPTFDHYIPMMYVLGMQQGSDILQFTHESIQYGSISMRSFMIS
ncbi:MAG: 4,5-DOPA dioxygenase extradiol [Bacteroidota bacterium]